MNQSLRPGMNPPCILAVVLLLAAATPARAWDSDPRRIQNVDLLDQLGGACRALAASGQTAVIGVGARLEVVDLSGAKPRTIGSHLLPETIKALCLRGDLAFVMTEEFWVLDVGDPARPRELSRLPVKGDRLIPNGNFIYVIGSQPNLQIVDVGIPSSPRLVSAYDLPHTSQETYRFTGLVIRGTYALVSTIQTVNIGGTLSLGYLVVLDLRDPKKPRRVFTYGAIQPAVGLMADANRLYLVGGPSILVFNIDDPSRPDLLATLAGPELPFDVAFASGRLYVAGRDSQVRIYAGQSGQPIRETQRIDVGGDALQIAATDNRLLVAGGWAGLRVYAPAGAEAFEAAGVLDTIGEASDLCIVGPRAYVAGGRSGVHVLDLAVPHRPVPIGRAATSGSAIAIQARGRHAFVAAEASGLLIFDIADPARPRLAASLAVPGSAVDVAVSGTLALVSCGASGLAVVNIADPRRPALLGRCDNVYAISAAPAGRYAYVSNPQAIGISVVDLADPTSPRCLGTIRTSGPPQHIVVKGDRLAVAEAGLGISYYDISKRDGPRRLGGVGGNGWFQGASFHTDMTCVADYDFGLRVINPEDPAHPAVAGFFATPGRPRRVAESNGLAYLAAGEAGLYVLRYHKAPDLTAVGFDYRPSEVLTGDEFFIEGDVFNLSDVPTTSGVWVSLMLSRSSRFTRPRRLLCPRLRIEPGMRNRDTINLADQRFVVLADVPPGVYWVGVVVDSDNELAELSEDNNTAWTTRHRIRVNGPAGARHWENYR